MTIELYIFRYLLRNNANVAAVNNDGDLPFDICEEDEMEKLLQESMDEQGMWLLVRSPTPLV